MCLCSIRLNSLNMNENTFVYHYHYVHPIPCMLAAYRSFLSISSHVVVFIYSSSSDHIYIGMRRGFVRLGQQNLSAKTAVASSGFYFLECNE